MIARYDRFILEKAINESTLYVSPAVLKRLQKIDSEIAKDLIAQLGQDIKPDATFLDESDKDGELTFITMRNATKKLGDIYHGDEEFVKSVEKPHINDKSAYSIMVAKMLKEKEPEFWKQSRNPIKIGRLINQAFPGKYSAADVEKFVNAFKSSEEKERQKFILVDGEEIEKYYWHENYKEMAGDLGRSCMARKKKFFDMYVKNPQVCRLLVLLEDDKVIGRSLIWKLESSHCIKDEKIEYFMDRQYTIEQSDETKFRTYAKENGWAYKTYNNHHSYSTVTYKGDEMICHMSVKLLQNRFDSYPYMDTFKRFDPNTGELFNDKDKEEEYDGQYILEDTDGDYELIEDGKWSEYYDRMVPTEEAVWSDAYGWLPEDRAIYIESRRSRTSGWFPEDDDNIYYSEWDQEYLHLDDCVYSDDKDEYIYKPNAVLGVYEIDGGDYSIETSWYHKDDDDCVEIDKTMRWYEVLSEKNSDWDDASRMKLSIADRWSTVYKEYYPKIFKVFLYRAKNSKDKIYLSVRDAKILGLEYDKEDKIEIDDFEYHKRMSEAGPEEDSLLRRMIDLLINDLIPNTERIADEGEEDMKMMYEERLERIWNMMPSEYQG